MSIKLYVSRTSGNILMKCHQNHIKRILDMKNISYEEVDVADPHLKAEREFMQNTLKLSDEDLVSLPPQIFKDGQHRGDYDAFFGAVEKEEIFSQLGMDPPPGEVEYERKLEKLRPDAGFVDQGEIVQLKYL